MIIIVALVYVAVLILNLITIQAVIKSDPWRLALSAGSFIPGWQLAIFLFLLVLKFVGRP